MTPYCGAQGGGEFAQSLDELRGTLLEAVDHADVPVADSREIAAAFDQVAEISRQGGIDGIASFFDEQFSQFDEILTEGRDWGREGHSPLEWWQWLIIIGIRIRNLGRLLLGHSRRRRSMGWYLPGLWLLGSVRKRQYSGEGQQTRLVDHPWTPAGGRPEAGRGRGSL
ncbi:hypothetical protein [Streptomyces cupreus]|uniref:Uncharacterized protein n=1 Tax=Streptomyces cupreus TaxID=2759956 RepID=A0A7X1ME59_9ACTN|nr:hypothetical protein [Streptomyces cupreus]MBC2905410.1 hypothetical protein [Streptomyces cupreus]